MLNQNVFHPCKGVHHVERKASPQGDLVKKKRSLEESFFKPITPKRRTRLNYIFVGCDSHDKTLVNRIALNREAAERKGFAATGAGRRKMIEYLKERSRLAGGATVVVAYEASGNGFILCEELKKAGFACHVRHLGKKLCLRRADQAPEFRRGD